MQGGRVGIRLTFTNRIPDRLRQPALADLAGDEVVDVVLELVDLLDAGDFALVEFAFAYLSAFVLYSSLARCALDNVCTQHSRAASSSGSVDGGRERARKAEGSEVGAGDVPLVA